MDIKIPQIPTAWACRKCGKADWADDKEQRAKPEHVSYRGVDLGECVGRGGIMIPLYSEEDIRKANMIFTHQQRRRRSV